MLHAILEMPVCSQVKDVSRKETRRSPSPPFTTSTLQQAASSRLHMSPSRTMSLAQQLYEGVSDEGGPSGLAATMLCMHW